MTSASDDSYLLPDYIEITYEVDILTNQIVDQLDFQ